MGATHIWGKTTNYTRTGHIAPTNKGRKPDIQFFLGMLLYYVSAFCPTMLVALVSIAYNQAKINETTS